MRRVPLSVLMHFRVQDMQGQSALGHASLCAMRCCGLAQNARDALWAPTFTACEVVLGVFQAQGLVVPTFEIVILWLLILLEIKIFYVYRKLF